MGTQLKCLEIFKFKSIVKQVGLIDLSFDSNVVFVPFDSELSDDLIEAIEYVVGKEIEMRDSADVNITVSQDSVEKKFKKCSTGNAMPDQYYKYEMNVPHQITRDEYLMELGMLPEQGIVINRNGNVKEFAASLNVAPLLERFCNVVDESTAEMQETKNLIDNSWESARSVRSYQQVLRKRQASWKRYTKRFANLKESVKTQKRVLDEMKKAAENILTESRYFDGIGAVNYDVIINELNGTIDAQSIASIPVDDDLEDYFAINEPPIADEEMDLPVECTEFDEHATSTMFDGFIDLSTERINETKATEKQASMDSNPLPMCRHQDELKQLQLSMSAKLNDFAFDLENIRPIINRHNNEIPQRFCASIVPLDQGARTRNIFGSVAFEPFCRKIMARNEHDANEILTHFEVNKIKSIDLILQADSVQKDETPAAQNTEKISTETWRTASPMKANILNILDKYMVCDDERNAAALVNGNASKSVVFVNGLTLNSLRMMECGQSDAFNKSEHKIYCVKNCMNFGTFAVVALPHFYSMAKCLPLNTVQENEIMPIESTLQRYQNELQEHFVKRIESKWNEWQTSDRKKQIEWNESELNATSFHHVNLQSRLSVNLFGVERKPFIKPSDHLLREQKDELKLTADMMRDSVKKIKEAKLYFQELSENRSREFKEFFDQLNGNIGATYKGLLDVPTAVFNFDCLDATSLDNIRYRYEYQHPPLSTLSDLNANTNRYMAAIALMLGINDVHQPSTLVADDFQTMLSDIDLRDFLQYIFQMAKQKIVVLSKPNAIAAQAVRTFWISRNVRGEYKVVDLNTLPA